MMNNMIEGEKLSVVYQNAGVPNGVKVLCIEKKWKVRIEKHTNSSIKQKWHGKDHFINSKRKQESLGYQGTEKCPRGFYYCEALTDPKFSQDFALREETKTAESAE